MAVPFRVDTKDRIPDQTCRTNLLGTVQSSPDDSDAVTSASTDLLRDSDKYHFANYAETSLETHLDPLDPDVLSGAVTTRFSCTHSIALMRKRGNTLQMGSDDQGKTHVLLRLPSE